MFRILTFQIAITLLRGHISQASFLSAGFSHGKKFEKKTKRRKIKKKKRLEGGWWGCGFSQLGCVRIPFFSLMCLYYNPSEFSLQGVYTPRHESMWMCNFHIAELALLAMISLMLPFFPLNLISRPSILTNFQLPMPPLVPGSHRCLSHNALLRP